MLIHGVPGGAVTVRTSVEVALAKLSLTFKVTNAEPVVPAVGVNVTVRFDPEPPKTIPLMESSPGLSLVAETTRPSGAVSWSAMVNASAPVLPFAWILCAGTVEMLGGVFSPALNEALMLWFAVTFEKV